MGAGPKVSLPIFLEMTRLAIVILLLGGFVTARVSAYESLFNGKNLDGWDGNPELWSVEDGVIVGRTKGKDHLKYNEFLIWRGGQVKNFELKVVAKVTGNNSGIQYRSKELPQIGKWVVGGYQCDMHPNPPYNAMIYEEKGRGILVKNGQSIVTDQKSGKWLVAERDPVTIDPSEWHEYTIIAKGNHITQKIDGKTTIEFVDHDLEKRSLEGLVAIQVHRGPAMEVQIRSVELKHLPDGGVTPFSDADVPPDAQRVGMSQPRTGNGLQKAGQQKGGQEKAGKTKAKAKAKAKARPPRPTEVGPEIGENKATPVGRIKAPEGFEVELIYSVPGREQGSWVALCHDDKGRIYASDQYGVLYRFNPPAPGAVLKPGDVEQVPVDIRAINGMVFAFGALYVGVNDYENKIPSGLYRISDSDGDDQLDKVEILRAIESKGDHGVHAVLPTHDGEDLLLVTGNNAIPTGIEDSSPVPQVWGDDLLLPRMPDGRGHNRHRLAPGGIIYRVSPDGKKFEAVASGFRNIYDASINKDGEIFTYDADMEYDFNTPWYRPTRVNHVVSGAEFGWRNGAGKYPEFYIDNLPASVNIGPGSPTGTIFGYGAKFPQEFQEALYIFDWSWGKIYRVNLEPDGASYKGLKEDFITGAPLPVTDVIIHPEDGAMYFAIGGRRVQSGLYRVTYSGSESTGPVDLTPTVSEARALRHKLEAFHGKRDPKAVETVWPYLDHSDRFIRWAARVALEHQPVESWREKALAEPDGGKQVEALLALVRVGGKCPHHREEAHVPDAALRDQLIDACLGVDWDSLNVQQRKGLVRVTQIVLHRFGKTDDGRTAKLIARFDPVFPAPSFEENWLLCDLLVFLQAPNTAQKGMRLIAEAASQEPQMQFARSLRMLRAGWTPELREQQLEWFLKAANYRGGASFAKFIEFIRNDSLATFTDAEKETHAELMAKKAEQKSAIENAGAIFAGRTPTMWTLEELSKTGLFAEFGDVIASGSGAVGIDFSSVSEEFRARFEKADLVFAKGMASYETLSELPASGRIVHCLMAKCLTVAESLGTPQDSYVVMIR